MGYDAAEQAYGEHRFAEAQALLNEHLTEQPNDPRAVLLQAYIHFYGFQDTAAAASSYRRVLELQTEGPYYDLATEGLKSFRMTYPTPISFEYAVREPIGSPTHFQRPSSDVGVAAAFGGTSLADATTPRISLSCSGVAARPLQSSSAPREGRCDGWTTGCSGVAATLSSVACGDCGGCAGAAATRSSAP